MQLLVLSVKVIQRQKLNTVYNCLLFLDRSTLCNECNTGEVRLTHTVDSKEFTAGNLTRAGRVEICINNAWGTICNSSFDEIEAQTACSNLEGFSYQGNHSEILLCYILVQQFHYRIECEDE